MARCKGARMVDSHSKGIVMMQATSRNGVKFNFDRQTRRDRKCKSQRELVEMARVLTERAVWKQRADEYMELLKTAGLHSRHSKKPPMTIEELSAYVLAAFVGIGSGLYLLFYWLRSINVV